MLLSDYFDPVIIITILVIYFVLSRRK